MSKEKIIYTRWLAAKLRNAGFKILRVEANPHKPELDCYVFEDSIEFQKAITSFAGRKNKQ